MPTTPMNDWSKEQLEAEQIRRDLRTPWVWRNIQPIVTCIVGVLGLVYAAKTDLFEVQRQQLELNVSVFEARRDSLHRVNDELFATNQRLVADRTKLLAERTEQDSISRAATLESKRAQAALLPMRERAAFMARAHKEADSLYRAEQAKSISQSHDLMAQKYGFERLLGDCQSEVGNLRAVASGLDARLKLITALELPKERVIMGREILTVADLVDLKDQERRTNSMRESGSSAKDRVDDGH